MTVDHPQGLMRLTVTEPLWVIDPTEPDSGPASRWQLRTLSGDPTILTDDNKIIASVVDPISNDLADFSSITTVSVNNTDVQAPDQVTWDTSAVQEAGNREFWTLLPTARSRDIIYRLLIPIDDPDPDQALELIELELEAWLLRDTVKLDYILRNRGTRPHTVGLRIFIDCQFGGGLTQLDGTSIILSDGTIVTTEEAFSTAQGTPIPDGWVSFDSISNPSVILRGTLTGGEVDDPGRATFSGGAPDRLEFGQRVNMGRDNQFLFTPNQSAAIAREDWGYALVWDEERLDPGASRRYVTYYGLGGSVSDFTPPYVLAAYAPFELQVVEGDDSTTPGLVEDSYLGDRKGNSSWDVLAFCDNFMPNTLQNARVTISLPQGLELDSSVTQSRTVLLGNVGRNEQAAASWKVRAMPDLRPGVHEIRVVGPLGRSVRRKINIPALPVLSQNHLDPVRGLDMVTVPYHFQITDAEHVFGSLGSLQGSDAALVRWDPKAQLYRFFPDTYVTNIQPGCAYWLLNRLRQSIVFPDPPDRGPVPTVRPYAFALEEGWNQIGSPFISSIRLDKVTVVSPDGRDLTVMEAYNAGLIVPTIYSYDPTINDYVFVTNISDAILEPYVGYWVLALRPVTILFPAPTLIPFDAQPPLTAPAAKPEEGWRAPLVVSGGKTIRHGRAFGASSTAADGLDVADVMCPPPAAAPNGVRLNAYFVRDDLGPRSGQYFTDIRSVRPGKQSWTFVVDTEMANTPITISWPDLAAMPRDLIATLEDLQTGRASFMRVKTGYTFNSAQGGARQFRVTVEPRQQATLQITAFRAAPVGQGVELTCTLSAPAAVDVTVRNIAGRPIKQVCQNRELPAGEASVLWTGQADSGLTVPNGPYVIEIVAQSPETGERVGILRTVHYRR